jgi:hypothetical protein
VNIRFSCPICACPGRLVSPGNMEWQCPECDHVVHAQADVDPALTACPLCGGQELYKKKDFPHKLGMGILVAACLASSVTTLLYQWWLTWGILIGSAAFDGILYLLVKDVVVCYRCQALFRGVPAHEHHQPFELTVHERYRQEKLRREELRKAATGVQLEIRNPKSEIRNPK